MGELDKIDAEVANAEWPSALGRALSMWRARRTLELGELVDAIGARCTDDQVVSYLEWRDRACRYDPVEAGTLLAHVETIAPHDPTYVPAGIAAVHHEIDALALGHEHVLARLLYASRWPPDPRFGAAVVRWLETASVSWPRGWYGSLGDREPLQRVFAALSAATRLAVDARLVPRLRRLVEQPPGRSTASRAAQLEIAGAALTAIAELPASTAESARITAIVARIGAPARDPGLPQLRRYDPDALWNEIARAPDDDGPREVLADALLSRDDPRGLLFVYQLGRLRGESKGVIRRHWPDWAGPELARLVLRRQSVFRRGMLDEIRIGPGSTPAWIYDHVAGHRELVAVRTVRKLMVAPRAYARFIGALPNVRAIEIDSVEMAEDVRAYGRPERITELTLTSREGESAASMLTPLVGMPLATLTMWLPPLAQLAEVLGMFPRLTAIKLRPAGPIEPALRAELAAIPIIQIE